MLAIPTPDFDDPKEIYAFFGLAAYHASLLEASFINWTVALRLGGMTAATRHDFDSAFEYSEARTLGQLLGVTRTFTAVPKDLDGLLAESLVARNRLIHRFYREHAQNLIHLEGQKLIIGELSSMIELFQRADSFVTPLYLSLWAHFGVDEAMIEQELAESLREVEARYGPV